MRYLITIYLSKKKAGIIVVKKTREDVETAITDARYYEKESKFRNKKDAYEKMKNIRECLEWLRA